MSNESLNTSPPEVDYSEIGKLNTRLTNIDLSDKLILDFSKTKSITLTSNSNTTEYSYTTESLSNSGLLIFYVKITVSNNVAMSYYWYTANSITYNAAVTSGMYYSGTNAVSFIANKGQQYCIRGNKSYDPTSVTCYLTPFATISV